jgi:hypothetical protein
VAWRRATGARVGDVPCPECGRALVRADTVGPPPWRVLADAEVRSLAAPELEEALAAARRGRQPRQAQALEQRLARLRGT